MNRGLIFIVLAFILGDAFAMAYEPPYNYAILQSADTIKASPKITKSSGMFHTIDLVSPQILTDTTSNATPNGATTIIFRVKVPNAKEVTVDGDFLPSQKRPAQMSKDESGLWEYIYSADENMNGLFTYVFYVDGLRFLDPSNINIIRNDTQFYNYFVINEDAFSFHPSDFYLNNTSKQNASSISHGSILHTWYRSDSLNMERRLTIYLPADYFESFQKSPAGKNASEKESTCLNASNGCPLGSYKVLYLLHGMGGDEDSWLRFGRIQQIMDYLIAEKMVEPLIVVMPNGNVDVDAAPGESALGYNVPNPYLPHTMDGTFEKYFGEIVNFIDSHFKTEQTKSGRLIAGYSMGGLNALWAALNNPNNFAYVALFSPAIGFESEGKYPIYSNLEEKFNALIERDFQLLWMKIGRNDFLIKNFESQKDIFLKILSNNALVKNNREFSFVYDYSEGGHIWANWRNYLIEFLTGALKEKPTN